MPIYEYACSACGHQFEEWQKMSDPRVTTCPKCKKKKVERLISATAFQLKGGGWYADLYSSSKPGGGKESGDSGGGESKGDKSDKGQAKAEKSDKSSSSDKGGKDAGAGKGGKPSGETKATTTKKTETRAA